MHAASLVQVPAAIVDHECGCYCDRTTHAITVCAPDAPGTVDTLDALAHASGVIFCSIEAPLPGAGPWLVRWARDDDQTSDPQFFGVVLVRWLARIGRTSEAIHAAYRLRLIDDEAFEQAWQNGTDVLAGVGS